MTFDVFLAYASEDAAVARPLALELSNRGWRVWFDEFELSIGHNLIELIEDGWANARIGVVVLSPAFFGKHWPRRELEGLMSRELAESTKLILPVWHNVEAADVARLWPSLADRVAITTAAGTPDVANAIEEVLRLSLDLLQPGPLPTVISPEGRPLDQADPVHQTFDLSVVEFNDRVIAHLAANPELLHQLSPRRFEILVAELYARAGFAVQLTPASGDGGVDVYAIRRDDLGSTLIVVQAKRYKPELKVEASVVRELFGTVNLTQASAGVLVTTSSFQPGAERLAEQHEWRLSLRDYTRLQRMLKTGSA